MKAEIKKKFVEILEKITEYPAEKIEQYGEEDWLVSVSQSLKSMQLAYDLRTEELKPYLEHKQSCAQWKMSGIPIRDSMIDCTCGLDNLTNILNGKG